MLLDNPDIFDPPLSPQASEEGQPIWANRPHSFERSEHQGLTEEDIRASFALACSIVAGFCFAPQILVPARDGKKLRAADLRSRLDEGRKLLEPILKQALDNETVEKLLDARSFDESLPCGEDAADRVLERLILQSAKLWQEREYSRLISSSVPNEYRHRYHIHELLPTIFLPRAADIGPDVRSAFSFLVFRVDILLMTLFRLWLFIT